MKNKNIHAIDGGKKFESELKQMIGWIISGMPEQIELMHIKAKLCREYYNSLVKEGFSKSEALELCKSFTTQI